MLMKTENVLKKNMKINVDSIPQNIRDSVCLAQSVILKLTNEKTLTNILFTGITDELKKRNFKVFTEEDMTAFMKLDSGAYIFHIAQIELDEYYIPDSRSQMYDTLTFYKSFDLNAISINLWYEVSQLNSDQNNNTTLFSSDYIDDKVNGFFRISFFTGEVDFVYNRKDITVDDLYSKASEFGISNAEYIYDYFLNKYIYTYYKGDKKPKYIHYNAHSKKLYPAGQNRFIFM